MSVAATVTSGSLLLAVPVSVLAGLVSFLSPCVLPLVPGYLSYVTGLAGADLADARRGRLLAGAGLFVLGFSAVFVSAGAFFGTLGMTLQEQAPLITRVLGAVTIFLGLAFMGVVPGFSRDLRLHQLPRGGLLGAPLLGGLFGLGWVPCIGPTLAAVQLLAFDTASAGRGALLGFAYCLGLGMPFIAAALAFRWALGTVAALRRHARAVMVAGGAMLVVIGALLATGLWDTVTIGLRHLVSGYTTVL